VAAARKLREDERLERQRLAAEHWEYEKIRLQRAAEEYRRQQQPGGDRGMITARDERPGEWVLYRGDEPMRFGLDELEEMAGSGPGMYNPEQERSADSTGRRMDGYYDDTELELYSRQGGRRTSSRPKSKSKSNRRNSDTGSGGSKAEDRAEVRTDGAIVVDRPLLLSSASDRDQNRNHSSAGSKRAQTLKPIQHNASTSASNR
jgi:hypothetical protein